MWAASMARRGSRELRLCTLRESCHSCNVGNRRVIAKIAHGDFVGHAKPGQRALLAAALRAGDAPAIEAVIAGPCRRGGGDSGVRPRHWILTHAAQNVRPRVIVKRLPNP